MIDTHAHLCDAQFDSDRDEIINNMPSDNLDYVVNVAFDMQSSEQSVELAQANTRIYATVGVHPEEVDCWDENSYAKLSALAHHPKVVAIGEIGLDYHYTSQNKDKQIEVFVEQLKLAHECGLPVVIHNRDSIGDMLDVLEHNVHLLQNGGILHCFSESVEVYRRISKLGLKIGVGGICTFQNARKTVEVLSKCELEDFVVETDCPYLAPVPYRGTRNQPKYVKLVIDKIAQIKGVSANEIERISTQNALRVYKKIGETNGRI